MRLFQEAIQKSKFVAGLSRIVVHIPPKADTMDITALEGNELSTVAFVQDHLLLDFDGPTLTLYTWPDVFREEGSYAYGEPEYRNWLCALLGQTVTTASCEELHALEIEFESGVILRASLREEDLDAPRAGEFSHTGGPSDAEDF
jgi:hypothetical protein